MRILVTGGAGFIASFLVDELVRLGHDVRVFDNLAEQVHLDGEPPDYLNPEAEFIRGDVRDREILKCALDGVEAVFHEAAAVGVGQSQYEIKHYVDANIGGTANLLDILANEDHRVGKIVVAASMSSYGEGCYRCETHGIVRPPLRTDEQMAREEWELFCPECGSVLAAVPTDETAAYFPNSVYAITKEVQEDLVLNFGRTYGIPAVALRYFNVYGPRQSLSNPYTGVAAIFLSRLKNGNPPVVYEDGLQTRDFVSVHDVVRANVLALERTLDGPASFNIGMGTPRTIVSIAETLADLLEVDITPHVAQTFRKGDVRHVYADVSRAREQLGFEPRVSFEDGMRELIQWSLEAKSADYFEEATEQLKRRGLVT
ncbi:MAG: NAD-dependent epimerase/dehydratase family protein [Nitrospinota bacterium]